MLARERPRQASSASHSRCRCTRWICKKRGTHSGQTGAVGGRAASAAYRLRERLGTPGHRERPGCIRFPSHPPRFKTPPPRNVPSPRAPQSTGCFPSINWPPGRPRRLSFASAPSSAISPSPAARPAPSPSLSSIVIFGPFHFPVSKRPGSTRPDKVVRRKGAGNNEGRAAGPASRRNGIMRAGEPGLTKNGGPTGPPFLLPLAGVQLHIVQDVPAQITDHQRRQQVPGQDCQHRRREAQRFPGQDPQEDTQRHPWRAKQQHDQHV